MQKNENNEFLKQKEEKREKEINKLMTKKENEINVFENKMYSTFNEFKKTRAIETEKYNSLKL